MEVIHIYDTMVEQITNVVYDTHYPLTRGGNNQDKVNQEQKTNKQVQESFPPNTNKKEGFFDRLVTKLFFLETKKKDQNKNTIGNIEKQATTENSTIKNKTLKEQVQYILNLPDSEYSDKKLTN